MLMANGIKAVAYHAGLDSKLRSERQDQFLNEDVQVIVRHNCVRDGHR